MAKNWKEIEHTILARLDIEAEVESFGIRFSSREANRDGWRECHAFGREDAKPSAAINVASENGTLGLYADRATGLKSIKFFELAARCGAFVDWRAAREHYAAAVGVALPKRGGKRKNGSAAKKTNGPAVEQLTYLGGRSSTNSAAIYATKKDGVTPEAVVAAGGVAVDWPATAPSGKQCRALAFNAFLPGDWGSPVAILLLRETAEPFQAAGDLHERKTHLVRGSRCGLIVLGGPAALGAAETVWLCEGLPDALALHGHLPAGHVAATCSHGADTFDPSLVEAFRAKRAIVCYDSDWAGRSGSKKAAAALAGVAAEVRQVRLPFAITEKHGKDLRDWLNEGNGFDGLVKLADATPVEVADQPNEQNDETDSRTDAKELEPFDEAQAFLDGEQRDDVCCLRYWRDAWWRWRHGRYVEVPAGEIRAKLMHRLSADYRQLKSRITNDVIDHARSLAILPSEIQPPTWVEVPPTCADGSPWPTDDILIARNALVHLPSLVDGRVDFMQPPTPSLFALSALDYDFAIDAPKPTAWAGFLAQLWLDDPDSIATLQEWFGYCLTADTRQQKILVLIGPPRSGKGTIVRVLRELIGPRNAAGPTLDSLGKNFGLWPLIGKSLAVVADARLHGRTDQAAIVERLLAISGEDALTIDRKYAEPVTCKLDARLMVLSNELPRLMDASGALAGRMVMLRFSRSFVGQEDRQLGERLLAERAGILLWAVEGWRRLRERGRFVQPASGNELLDDLAELTSPVGAFVKERCMVGPEFRVARADLYHAYCEWARAKGRDRLEDESGFGQRLRAVLPNLRDSHPRIAGVKVRHYCGVKLT